MKSLTLILLLSFLVGCFGSIVEQTHLKGEELPEFRLQKQGSNAFFSTNTITEDKPFVVFYFTPTCPYCRAQTNDIVEEIDKLQNINFYFVSGAAMDELNKFENDFKLRSYSNITVARDTGNMLPNYYNISAVPYIAIYGQNKKLINSFSGKTRVIEIRRVTRE